MTSHVHAFEGREGSKFRTSLTSNAPTEVGKTVARTDTYHRHFVKLVPNERVVEVVEFETADPALGGEMTTTITLTDADGGTGLLVVHDGLPPGLPPANNETCWRMALAKLAALVEAGETMPGQFHVIRQSAPANVPSAASRLRAGAERIVRPGSLSRRRAG